MSKTALFKAARAWDHAAVTALLGTRPELAQARDVRGRTGLHLCAGRPLADAPASPAIATASALLAAGVDIDSIEEIADDGEVFPATALWYAAGRGRNLELVNFLLRSGANPDHCLWTVVWSRDVDTARALLATGSNTELRFGGETPLLDAARLGREPLIEELVRARADIGARDSKGLGPLHYARKRRLSKPVLVALGDDDAWQSRSP